MCIRDRSSRLKAIPKGGPLHWGRIKWASTIARSIGSSDDDFEGKATLQKVPTRALTAPVRHAFLRQARRTRAVAKCLKARNVTYGSIVIRGRLTFSKIRVI